MNKPHFHVTAGLLRHHGRLLIAKRAEGSHLAGFWEFPGGKKEDGETLEQCLKREIKEELGIKVQVEKLLFTVNHEYENRTVTLYLFPCTHLSGRPEPLQCEEVRWVYPEDLAQYRFPPPDLKIIRFLKHFNGMEAQK